MVIAKPKLIHSRPSGLNTVSKNFEPEESPKQARYIESPSLLSIRLALSVVYVTICILGPKAPINIPIIMGPPAIPNLIGADMPGIAIGSAPSNNPSTTPIHIDTKLGSRRVLTVLPIRLSTLSISSSRPTTMSLSPILKMRSGVARSIMPALDTLLIFTLKRFLNLRESMDLPLISGRVTTIQWEIS